MAGSEAVIEVRALSAHAEIAEAVELQQRVWGFSDAELVPLAVFVVARKTGGQIFGAYIEERMVGFCLAFPAIKPDGRSYLHSHMLAVLPEYRDRGVGRRLKLRQREDSLARGIDLIEWTFDPLEIKNAFFNIERLGAIVRHYAEDQYGTSSSPLHGGLPTDRCIAEWWIRSPRVECAVKGERPVIGFTERIAVPADIEQIRHRNPSRARAIQHCLARRFEACFSRGMAVAGFERGATEGVYLLRPWS